MNISYVHKGLFVSALKKASTSYTYLPVNMKCIKSDKVSSKLSKFYRTSTGSHTELYENICNTFKNVFTLYRRLVVFTM